MDAHIGLVRALVPVTLALHVQLPSHHPSVATLGEERMGSATLVDTQGILLTVNYVVMGGREIVATLADGQCFPAEIVAQDFESGIAVLSIPLRDHPAAALGESRRLALGQEVFVLACTGPAVRRGASGVICLPSTATTCSASGGCGTASGAPGSDSTPSRPRRGSWSRASCRRVPPRGPGCGKVT